MRARQAGSEGTVTKGGLLGQEDQEDDTPGRGPGGAPRPPEQQNGECRPPHQRQRAGRIDL